MTDIRSSYTFSMREQDRDSGYVSAELTRYLETDNLDDLAQAFLFFLWNSGYNYVDGVTIRKQSGGEVSTV